MEHDSGSDRNGSVVITEWTYETLGEFISAIMDELNAYKYLMNETRKVILSDQVNAILIDGHPKVACGGVTFLSNATPAYTPIDIYFGADCETAEGVYITWTEGYSLSTTSHDSSHYPVWMAYPFIIPNELAAIPIMKGSWEFDVIMDSLRMEML